MILEDKQELDQPQQININKEKLMYSPPTLSVIVTIKDVKGGQRGVSENICGCGIGS